MNSLAYIVLTTINIITFIFLLFRKLRSFNIKEEEVFDYIILNAIFIALAVVFEIYWFAMLFLVFDAFYIYIKVGWRDLRIAIATVWAYSLFFGIQGLLSYCFMGAHAYMLPLSVAFLFTSVLILNSYEGITQIIAETHKKVKKARKKAFGAKRFAR
jgi:hypothetical protein